MQPTTPEAPQVPQTQPTPPKKTTRPSWTILIILAIIAIAINAYAVWRGQGEEPIEPSELPEVSPIADWKSYQNEDYPEPYMLKYPNSWLVSEREIGEIRYAEITNNKKNQDKCSLEITDLGYGLEHLTPTTKEVTLDGIKFEEKRWSNDQGELEKITIGRSGGVLSFDIDVAKQNQEDCLVIINQILSTFKFIETVETADWQVYRNEEYGFEVKYPKNWEAFEDTGCKPDPCFFLGPDPHLSESGEGIYIDIHLLDMLVTETIEERMESFRKVRKNLIPQTKIQFAGQDAYPFISSLNKDVYEVLIPYQGRLYYIGTAVYNLEEVKDSLFTFKFIK